jgi:hypothetical protein
LRGDLEVTQAGPVTMTPPVKPVKRGPHTGSRTPAREAASSSWPEAALISSLMRDGEPYTTLAPAGRVMKTVIRRRGGGNGKKGLVNEIALAVTGPDWI